ncbi:MAG: EamA family transporter [Sphingomicrobium sp.]
MSAEPGLSRRAVILSFIAFTLIWGSTWIVIRGQIGTVPPQWSVAYRFIIAAIAMAVIAKARGQSLRLPRRYWPGLAFLGLTQFCINFNAVYIAELYITSGVVATMFALLLIPSSLLGWAMLGQRPGSRFVAGSVVAVAGIGLLLAHELTKAGTRPEAIFIGAGFTLFGMIGASLANVFQARPAMRQMPLLAMLAWSMAAGAAMDVAVALVIAGPPAIDWSATYWAGLVYLALAASVMAFILYYPVVRAIGPAKAAYSSMVVPVIAMGFSTLLEDYRWTGTTVSGAALALGGMAIAMSRNRSKVPAPDAG